MPSPGVDPHPPDAHLVRAFCHYHCRPCGRHFTSLEAFDGHQRQGECRDPKGLNTLGGYHSAVGTCRISGEIKREVEVWATRANQWKQR